MSKLWQGILYGSLVFVIIYLARLDYISLASFNYSFTYLLFSVFFLIAGFTLSALSWKKILEQYNISIPFKTAFISHGSNIFAKYIPGKVWMVLGRAGYLHKLKPGLNIKTLSVASLSEQIIFIWSGLLLSIFLAAKLLDLWMLLLFLLVLLFVTVLLFHNKVHHTVTRFIEKRFGKKVEIPHIPFILVIKMLLFCLLYWMFWVIGFYFLIKAVSPGEVPFYLGTIFPLSAIAGIMAIIAPGGIGVREGVMVLGLTYAGFNLEHATSVSILSRLWFVVGEISLFLSALTIKLFGKK